MKENDIASWIELAEHDFQAAEILIKENGPPDIIIYHYHQAAEKLFKALLIKKDTVPEKTHALDMLFNRILFFFEDLKSITKEVLFIHKFLPKLRYPQGDVITMQEAKEVKEAFLIIKENIMDKLK